MKIMSYVWNVVSIAVTVVMDYVKIAERYMRVKIWNR
jgi:hypothetical protein